MVVFLFSCTSPESRIYKEALEQEGLGHFRIAISEFDKVVRRSPRSSWGIRSAKEAARLSFYETKNYKKAAEFNKAVILNSKDAPDRFFAQKQIASIYFDNLQNYKKAIEEYIKLLQLVKTPTEEAQYRTNIARSYFYLNDFSQADIEIKEVLKLKIDSALRFAAYVLNGNILVAQKDFGKAADFYKKVIAEYPEKSLQENIQLSLAVCYEENNDYSNSILTLETLRGKYNPPEYIDFRIKRLKERQKNQPGAKGIRK